MTEMLRLHQENLELERKLEQMHRSIEQRLDGMTGPSRHRLRGNSSRALAMTTLNCLRRGVILKFVTLRVLSGLTCPNTSSLTSAFFPFV